MTNAASTQSPSSTAETVVTPGMPADAVAYHRLARLRPRYRWWRMLLVGLTALGLWLVMAGVFLFATGAGAALAGGGDVEALLAGPYFDLDNPFKLVVLLVPLILMIPALGVANRIVGGAGSGLLVSVTGRLRWRWLGRALLVAFAVLLPMIALSTWADAAAGSATGSRGDLAVTILMLAIVVLLVPFQAAAEEYVYRGYLMQTIGGWLKHPAFAILLPAPLFVLPHGYDIWGGLAVGAFAVVAGWLCWRTGGLEAAIAMHIANNVLLFVFACFGLADANATTGSPVQLLIQVAGLVVFAAVITRLSGGVRRYATSASASRIV